MAASKQRRKRRAEWLELAKKLPESPGVYVMSGAEDEVLYVGKAKNLRSRVTSYFQEGTSDYRAFVGILSRVLLDLDTVVTRSEKEALLLEREMIRRHEPRFNVIWRDDKQYLCLRIDTEHEYPWVEVVRNMGKDRARYFGPFHSASAARQTLRVVNRHFQLRTCRDSVLYNRSRPCLEYQIGRCPAPCVFDIDQQRYKDNVQDVMLFLEGRGEQLVKRLSERMWQASERLDFEVAAHYRDQKKAVEKTLEKQKVALPTLLDQDVIGIHREGDNLCFAVVEVRRGRVENIETQWIEGSAFSDGDLLESFLLQRYEGRTAGQTPGEVIVPIDLAAAEALGEILSEHRGKKVRLIRPQRGDRKALLEMARENAEHGFSAQMRKSGALERTLTGLKKKLRLQNVPLSIECYDISNLGETDVVGSGVCFHRGEPLKSRYRRYKVKYVEGQDDFASMYEILSRRCRRGLEEGDLPDLIVIDGGKGQLNAARAALKDHEVVGVDLVSLAKSRFEGDDGRSDRSPERVFLLDAKEPLILKQSSPELLLLARARDEAHRFAVSYQRKLRKKARIRSELDDIPGIGAARRKALLSSLGSVREVRSASIERLAAVPGIGRKAAERIWSAFHPDAVER